MPKFFFQTDDSERVEVDDVGTDLPDEQAAIDAAQVELADMAKEKLPDGTKADFSVTVDNAKHEEIYRGSLAFEGKRTPAAKPETPPDE